MVFDPKNIRQLAPWAVDIWPIVANRCQSLPIVANRCQSASEKSRKITKKSAVAALFDSLYLNPKPIEQNKTFTKTKFCRSSPKPNAKGRAYIRAQQKTHKYPHPPS